MYGVRLHPAKDREGTKLSLAVANSGVLVFQVKSSISRGHKRFLGLGWGSWLKIDIFGFSTHINKADKYVLYEL